MPDLDFSEVFEALRKDIEKTANKKAKYKCEYCDSKFEHIKGHQCPNCGANITKT